MEEFDWIIDAHEHNLLDDVVWERLLSRVQSGEFDGCLSGTPCDTFSAVRGQKDEPACAPKPLRSKEEPYGVAGLKLGVTHPLNIVTSLNTLCYASYNFCY